MQKRASEEIAHASATEAAPVRESFTLEKQSPTCKQHAACGSGLLPKLSSFLDAMGELTSSFGFMFALYALVEDTWTGSIIAASTGTLASIGILYSISMQKRMRNTRAYEMASNSAPSCSEEDIPAPGQGEPAALSDYRSVVKNHLTHISTLHRSAEFAQSLFLVALMLAFIGLRAISIFDTFFSVKMFFALKIIVPLLPLAMILLGFMCSCVETGHCYTNKITNAISCVFFVAFVALVLCVSIYLSRLDGALEGAKECPAPLCKDVMRFNYPSVLQALGVFLFIFPAAHNTVNSAGSRKYQQRANAHPWARLAAQVCLCIAYSTFGCFLMLTTKKIIQNSVYGDIISNLKMALEDKMEKCPCRRTSRA
ncbi:uncharacterized protein NEMAJ01_0383 [Nematocida major]|uniref:uncharacterized protein n=1 Tax=Nematocida major TaxID=1912982 RepID=UPI002008985E|nr:uncharacterized protein NEMAJ01_0383 [Nematocida major]KAH9385487.1 hypothetical protein NEMAJ01_0383 [Nematocida major]